jgi:hypothetical protein
MKKYRVGILMSSLSCTKYVRETVDTLANDPAIDLFLILENGNANGDSHTRFRYKLRRAGFLRSISLLAFGAYRSLEVRFMSLYSKSVRDHFRKEAIATDRFAGRIDVHPELSETGLFCSYGEGDIRKIKEAGLDIIVRGNTGSIYRGDVLRAARLGIISFHHGDNRWNRGAASAFWCVYWRRPATGFIIQILNEELDGGTVLYRGEIVTKRVYTRNLVNLYRESNPFLAYVTKAYLEGDPLIRPEARIPYGGMIYSYPNLWQTFVYVMRTGALFAQLVVERKLLRRDLRWGVAYTRRHWTEAVLARGKRIANPPHRFLADPFVVARDGRHYIFAEDYDERRGLGAISCIVVEPDDSYRIIDNILMEPFHLSFPLVFEEGGETYMIPETAECNAIRLYRCVEFPHKWELDMELVQGVSATDTMPVQRDGKWFLLTNISQFHTPDHLSQLHILWADKLRTTEWKRLSSLPIVNTPSIGRNAGFLLDADGGYYRVRQRQAFNLSGAGFSIARVTRLDTEGFAEETYAEIEPNFFPGLKGTHHMHGTGDFTVYDFLKSERYD